MGRTNPKNLQQQRSNQSESESTLTSTAQMLEIYKKAHETIKNVGIPSGHMTYGLFGVFNITTSYFVGVKFGTEKNPLNNIFRFEREKRADGAETHRFKCRDCTRTFSKKSDGKISHAEIKNGPAARTPCDSQSAARLSDCKKAVRCWAAFQAKLEALANGRTEFTAEEWAAWMKKAGQPSAVMPKEEKWNSILACVDKFLEQKPDAWNTFIDSIRDGQKLVKSVNKTASWKCRRQRDSRLFNDGEESAASEETKSSDEEKESSPSGDVDSDVSDVNEIFPATPEQQIGKGKRLPPKRIQAETPSTSVSLPFSVFFHIFFT